MADVANTRVLVTGAASGIGAAVAAELLAGGMRVARADVRPVADAAVREVDRAVAITLDVTDELAWNAALDTVQRAWGGLDVLVHCAGITGIDRPQSPSDVAIDDWRRVFAVNLDGVVIGCRVALPMLVRGQSPSIVIISSLAARMASPGACAYAASKAALCSYARSLALHGATLTPKVRVNCVLPGAIETPMWDVMLGSGPEREERMKQIAADVPLKRFGTADEMARLVAFLISDEAGYVTGTEFVIDGGQAVKA
ncbi:MAG: SDR family NAD(P)-dependent oxidoreductase [Phycisphaerae bacterium]